MLGVPRWLNKWKITLVLTTGIYQNRTGESPCSLKTVGEKFSLESVHEKRFHTAVNTVHKCARSWQQAPSDSHGPQCRCPQSRPRRKEAAPTRVPLVTSSEEEPTDPTTVSQVYRVGSGEGTHLSIVREVMPFPSHCSFHQSTWWPAEGMPSLESMTIGGVLSKRKLGGAHWVQPGELAVGGAPSTPWL